MHHRYLALHGKTHDEYQRHNHQYSFAAIVFSSFDIGVFHIGRSHGSSVNWLYSYSLRTSGLPCSFPPWVQVLPSTWPGGEGTSLNSFSLRYNTYTVQYTIGTVKVSMAKEGGPSDTDSRSGLQPCPHTISGCALPTPPHQGEQRFRCARRRWLRPWRRQHERNTAEEAGRVQPPRSLASGVEHEGTPGPRSFHCPGGRGGTPRPRSLRCPNGARGSQVPYARLGFGRGEQDRLGGDLFQDSEEREKTRLSSDTRILCMRCAELAMGHSRGVRYLTLLDRTQYLTETSLPPCSPRRPTHAAQLGSEQKR